MKKNIIKFASFLAVTTLLSGFITACDSIEYRMYQNNIPRYWGGDIIHLPLMLMTIGMIIMKAILAAIRKVHQIMVVVKAVPLTIMVEAATLMN